MVFSARFGTCLAVCGLALALAALPRTDAQAQIPTSSVETYVDQALPSTPPDGVLPENMDWNRPLKAGDMVLLPKKEPRDSRLANPPKTTAAPAGELKAPVIAAPSGAAKKALPPQIYPDRNSTASVMLLQGMKNALQQAGENTDIPKSQIKAPEGGAVGAIQAVSTDLKAPVLSGGKAASLVEDTFTIPAPAAPPPAASPAPTEGGIVYQPGQEPKTLFTAPTPAPQPAEKTAEKTEAPAGAVAAPLIEGGQDIVFPPEMASSSEAKAETPSAVEPTPEGAGFSIFGEPVKEMSDEAAAEPAPATPPAPEPAVEAPKTKKSIIERAGKGKKALSASCSPSVIKWSRDCQDAGYPATFEGRVVGETRIECPSGEAKDVWLSNSCAAGSGAAASDETTQPVAAPSIEVPAAQEETAAPAAVEPNVPPVVIQDDGAPVDASCGVANGLAALRKPAEDLCARGDASSVQGEGPWRWTCTGRHGGMTVSCAAPMAPKATHGGSEGKGGASSKSGQPVVEDGKCGAATTVSSEAAPMADLCAKGTASRVNGGGPWTWACSGLNGGQAAACTANKKVDAACGSASREGTDGMPMRDLCSAGYASAVTGEGPWNWTCSGLYGGAAATCSAQPKMNAVCGPASTKGHRGAPEEGLCQIGSATSVEGSGPWHWTCAGSHGGATVSCEASSLTDGACGTSNGGLFEKAPAEGLCASGRASRVTGQGPWSWTCAGVEGGNTASCTASVATKESLASLVSCGAAAETPSLFKPSENLCASGKPSAVTGEGPWHWSCSDESGHNMACATLSSNEGACGKAANVATSYAPAGNLCSSGVAGEVKPDSSRTAWTWSCNGSLGGGNVDCSAPMTKAATTRLTASEKPEVQCGASGGQVLTSAPEVDLCDGGKPSAVRGEGPWHWTCASSGKNAAKVNCEALKSEEGLCGSANGSIQRARPASSLCASGAATDVTGEGPWMWSCIGTGGGGSASCSALSQAQTKVDGTCGAAANASMTTAPEANLCDSGTPSTVYGEGPWTWTCSGLNGGIASTCSTSKIMPKAPPPPGPLVNGLCGPANGVASLVAPADGLCSAGTTTAMSGEGPWNWSCIGANGGMTVSCTAPLMPPAPIYGACGAASGVPTLAAPKSALCAAGISSAVSGKGPWTWSCSGTNGGGAVSCVAPLAGRAGGQASAPLPSLATPSLDNGEAPAPKAAPAGLVTPSLPAGPLPPISETTIPNRKTFKPTKGLPKESSAQKAPELEETLPDGSKPLMPPPLRDEVKPPEGLKPPIVDSEGNPVPGARLILDSSVTTISFAVASDQLNKDAVATVEKLAAILQANGNARITLIAYAGLGNDRPPREARRLSLNRALNIRDFLASKGISSSRVDVRPMGANVPSGDMDRVDIKAN